MVSKVHKARPEEINHSHYDVTKSIKPHQFELLYIHQTVFKGKKYKYVRTGVDNALRSKVERALQAKTPSENVSALEAIYNKGGAFKYHQVFQRDNWSEFKSDVTKLLKKHNADIRKTTKK